MASGRFESDIGINLTVGQAVTYFVQWLGAGIVISLIHAPANSSLNTI